MSSRFVLLLLNLALAIGLVRIGEAADPKESKETKGKPNKLAQESSPYLLQHAHNPVDWHPWGTEAFAKAKKEGKLVFLSIGYSSCHWCHVMEKESFSNPEVAKLMNQYFVCIKVDREERPDVDQVYMTALNALRQRGGWPLSMFLTAEGKPIFGGTYWPPDDKEIDGEKVLGFKSILKIANDFHKDKPKDLEEQADKVAAATTANLARAGRGFALVDLDRELLQGVVDAIKEEADPIYGGFGNREQKFRGTKFPTPPYLDLLGYEINRGKSPELAPILSRTLDQMAQGGIYDQLGGGFHRYSTERTWTVPHFEKMLYDNGQLLEVYAEAFRRTRKPLYRQTLQDTVGFIAREMTHPEGGFYSALDADSEGEEGRFYVWTPKDLEGALPKPADLALAKKVYGADEGLNFENKYNNLVRRKPLADVAGELKLKEAEVETGLEAVRKQLFAVRAKRERPFLDTKVLTGWNGQMIAGLAAAGMALDDKKAVDAAVKAADFVLAKLRTKEGRLMRTYGGPPGQPAAAKLNAYLDDYAYLVHGLLNLHDATKDARWLKEAQTLTDLMIKNHEDAERGGFFYTSHDHEKLFARAKDQYDGAQPAGNSVAARNLARLWAKTGDAKYGDKAEKTLKAFAGTLKNSPTSLATMAQAPGMYLDVKEKKGKN